MAEFLTAVVTAFDGEGNPDWESNRRLYESLIAGGSDGVVLLGSTGEFFSLDLETAKAVTRFALQTIGHRMKVYVGAGRTIPAEAVELGRYAMEQGADGVVLVSPDYFPLSDASAMAYFDATVPQIPGPVYLYNFPACTGYDLTPQMTLALRRKYANIAGYKHTVPNFGHTRALLEAILPEFPEFQVFSGFDEFFLHNLMSGGAGCIGGLPNLDPALFARWKREAEAGDWNAAAATQRTVNHMMAFFDICSPFVTAVKYAMHRKGILDHADCRAPIAPATPEQAAKLDALMDALGL